MYLLLIALLVGAACARPQNSAAAPNLEHRELVDRETACIALGTCPGGNVDTASTTAAATIQAPSSTAVTSPSSAPLASGAAASIGNYAVLGDSFASGVAWLPSKRYNYTDSDTCRRYFQAYGVRMEEDGRLGKNAELHFLACSGSRTDKVKSEQIPAIPKDVSFATVSVGGNDVGFFPVMNACVLRANKLTDQDCQNELSATENRIKNDVPGYKSIYSAFFNAGLTNSNFKLYVLGYPHFFNADTGQCNKATFAYNKDENGGPFLTTDIRSKINNLIQQMNDGIRSAIAGMNNKQVQFVDISPAFQGHRFCEEGIKEPYSGGIFTGIDDKAAWLYHFDWNPFHEMNAQAGQVTNYTAANWSCDKTLEADDDAGAVLQCGLADSGTTSLTFGGTLVEADGGTGGATLAGSDAGQYGLFQRTFHPTHRGHQAIRDAMFTALGV